MTVVVHGRGADLLNGWVDDQQRTTGRGRTAAVGHVGSALRFAFYGRASTEDFQDHESSRA
jgi:hypothetical protein